ncbi:hypothetical protein [Microbispora bryophytorum]|uniref:Uncharacterized protein n=1 Tax=Microbispora bryophytorum subsp. camponoti TaxID=1677852 RepID=A0ABR8L0J2_9ACTN|nr:hypothetical protein [Microbispora camponoti]MBD3142231.1 hypothetical protein [Microbispora camponoti]
MRTSLRGQWAVSRVLNVFAEQSPHGLAPAEVVHAVFYNFADYSKTRSTPPRSVSGTGAGPGAQSPPGRPLRRP